VERGRVVSVAYLSDGKKMKPEVPPRRNVIVLVYQQVESLVTREHNAGNIRKWYQILSGRMNYSRISILNIKIQIGRF
jgi:hypothetical protein